MADARAASGGAPFAAPGVAARRRRGPVKTCVFVAVPLLVVLLGAEALLAVLGRCTPDPLTYVGESAPVEHRNFVPDPHTGWRMRPGHSFVWLTEGRPVSYAADADGFRSAPGGAPPRSAPKRIVLLGDSFVWGTGLAWDETCGARLEEASPELQVLNRGMPGFGVDQIGCALRHWALPCDPDAVVVVLFNDDFQRSFHAHRRPEGMDKPVFRLDGGALVPCTSGDRPNPVVRFLERNSRLLEAWRRTARWAGARYQVGDWWNLNRALIDGMRQDAAERGVPLLFVHVGQIRGTPFPALRDYMEEHAAGYIDLEDMTPAERARFYLREDGHLNADGQRHLAERVREWIRGHVR